MQKKFLVLAVACILITLAMIGGCTSMQRKVTTMADKYPSRPITFIVPFGAGGAMDLIARMLEKAAVKHLGQPLVVVNKPGSAGILGWNELVTSNPDGYTIGISASELFLHPLYGTSKYNYPTALEPLAQISSTPVILVVKASSPWQNASDLINYAKEHPGELKFGHSGVGSIPNVVGETFSKSANIALNQVPFRSAAEAVTALLGDHIQMVFINPGTVKEHVKSGMLKTLAVADIDRLVDPAFSNAPTFKEQGFELFYGNQFGVAAPKEIPAEIRAQLIKGLEAMITDPEFKKGIEVMGLQYQYLDNKQTQEQWICENKKLTKTVQESGVIDLIKSQKQ